MYRVLRNLTVILALAGLWGCGASVDGGSGTVKEGPDLATSASLDQSSAPAGTNLVMTVEVTNRGTDASGDAQVNVAGDGWPIVLTENFSAVQFSCSVEGSGSCGPFEASDDGVRSAVSLDPGATATYVGRLPLAYTSDGDEGSVSVEVCADELSLSPSDTDPGNNCDSVEATVDAAQEIVDFRDEIIYWALTDRFFNGDTTNDNGNGDRAGDTADPNNIRAWHGGDFAGLAAKIEEGYFQAMGFTAIWISPVVYQVPAIDGGDFAAYHGYWLENYDDPEPHFGSWQELNDLVARRITPARHQVPPPGGVGG